MNQEQLDRMDLEVSSAVKGNTVTDQKANGSYKTNVNDLAAIFREIMAAGYTDIDVFEKSLKTLLHQFEVIRLATDQSIAEYESKIAYCRGRQRAASEHANLILAILATQVEEAKRQRALAPKEAPATVTAPDGTVRMTEEEARKHFCACMCRDEIDIAECSCECHVVGYCMEERCLVCPEKRPEPSKPRRNPPKKTTSKAKAKTKNTTAKKK